MEASASSTLFAPAEQSAAVQESQPSQPAREAAASPQEILLAEQNMQQAAWNAQVERWREEISSDPELGGERLNGTVARAQNALNRFDSEDRFIASLLQESGYGNHPQVLRFFTRIADSLAEDNFSAGGRGGILPPLEERMYAGWGR